MGGAGDDGSAGDQAPERCRSARPRVKARGRGVFSQNQAQRATGATDTHCPPYGAPASSATHEPLRTSAGKGPVTTGRALGASLSLIPLRRLRNWRVDIEARISHLKRAFGLRRTRLRRLGGART
jgi:hypothetical protein